MYSLQIHYSINYFGRSKTIWMLTFLLIYLNSILHQFATNLEQKKEKRYYHIETVATVIEDGKIDDLHDIEEECIIENCSPEPNCEFSMQVFPDKCKNDGLRNFYCKSS